LYRECWAGAQIIFPESGRGLGHVTPTIFGSTVGYPSDSLASCLFREGVDLLSDSPLQDRAELQPICQSISQSVMAHVV